MLEVGVTDMAQMPVVIDPCDDCGPTNTPPSSPPATTIYDSRQSSPSITIVAFPSITSELPNFDRGKSKNMHYN